MINLVLSGNIIGLSYIISNKKEHLNGTYIFLLRYLIAFPRVVHNYLQNSRVLLILLQSLLHLKERLERQIQRWRLLGNSNRLY